MELQDKKYRILDIFFRLLKGEFVSSKELLVRECESFSVNLIFKYN